MILKISKNSAKFFLLKIERNENFIFSKWVWGLNFMKFIFLIRVFKNLS